MSILSDNLRYLRMQKKGFSQRKMAEDLIITRERYAKYEDGSTEPPLEILLRISRYFRISMDLLVTVDLRKYKLEDILKLPDNRILLPIKTDSIGENLIEVVPYKASMGYLSGYADPEYIENLQTMSLPFLHNGKYRAFPAEGDSMPPYKDGTYVIGQYVERITDIKVGKTYILITKSGFLFKRIERIHETTITVKSDNTFYNSYDIPFSDIWEVWQHAGSYSPQELEVIDFSDEDIKTMFQTLLKEIKDLKKSEQNVTL